MTEPDIYTDDQIAAALRADTPEPDPAFEAELRKLVADGFPRKRRLPAFKLNRPLVAAAASILLAVAVAVPLISGRENDEPATLDSATVERPRQQLAAPGAGEADFAPNRTRRIERSASLTLAAPGDEIDKTADDITTITERYRGFVLRSSLSSGEDGDGGNFLLRIPAKDLQPALADLAKLGEVRSRSQNGQDVTQEFVSAADRLQAARAERRSLLRRLENAGSDTEAEAIRRRLDLNAGEIRGLRGQVRELRARTDYAAVSVSLAKDGDDGGSAGGGDGLGGALDDAVRSLEDSVEILVRALGIAIPVGLLAAALALGARGLRRRRRETALG
jgi:Domain of unknown function (DUF4349)